MKFPEDHPMEQNFIFRLQKMVSQKSDIFQDEFFRRVHIINHYMNEAGGLFSDLSIAAKVALDMDLEEAWGEDIVNQ